MTGRKYQACTDSYRYGFNGKEKSDEVYGEGNAYDFGARILDPRLGRWLGVDPLQIKYPFSSPFAFALNTPIQAKDPDGKLVIFINGQHGGTAYKGYWEGFDDKVMKRIGDKKPRYYDGALGGWFKSTLPNMNTKIPQQYNNSNLNPLIRYGEGYLQGKKDAADIIANLQKDANGNIIESIKIVSHSMGGTYSKGFVQALTDYVAQNNKTVADKLSIGEDAGGNKYYAKPITGFKIEFEVDFAPFQPGMQTAVEGVRTIQASHTNDKVVNNPIPLAGSSEEKIEGVEPSDYHLDKKDKTKGHDIHTFTNEINTTVPQSSSNPKP